MIDGNSNIIKSLKKRIKELEVENKALKQKYNSCTDKTYPSINIKNINISWNLDKGITYFQGLPVAWMWLDTTLAGLMQGVERMVGKERFLLALQAEGRKSVDADWEVINSHQDFFTGFKAIAEIACVAGWGIWELTKYDPIKKKCIFLVRNSWEGLYQKNIGVEWGSAMLAGKFAGYCTKLFKTNCWSIQKQYIAKGDDYDEFIVTPSHKQVEKEIDKLLIQNKATITDLTIAYQKIIEKDKQLLKYQEHLTDLVEERTKELNLTNQRLSELNATKDKFFSIIAHDLRSPFNSVIGFADLLLEDLDNNNIDSLKDYMKIIHKTLSNSYQLLENLLAWAKSQTGILKPRPTKIDLFELLNDCLLQIADFAKKKEIIIENKVPINSYAFADHNMINSVIRNLISNAIKFTHKGGKIQIYSKLNKKSISVYVKDNGIGISEKYIKKLYDFKNMISRVGTNNEKGTGLGLIICKDFIEKNNGKLYIESKPDIGSIFSFKLPIID